MQARPLEAIYPFVWLDAIHYKIKEEGRYITKAVYTVLGMNKCECKIYCKTYTILNSKFTVICK